MGGVDENNQTRKVSEKYLDAFGATLADAVQTAEEAEVSFVMAGSLALNAWGRPSPPGDIDMVVKPTEARRLLEAFEKIGYETEEAEPQWLYKAQKDDITIDLIFEMEKSLYLDDEMIARAALQEFRGVHVKVMPPEDYVVSQALSTKEDTPDYWYNALSVLARSSVDWDYLLQRASCGPRRVLSLLIYAQSNDLPVPHTTIQKLFDTVYGT